MDQNAAPLKIKHPFHLRKLLIASEEWLSILTLVLLAGIAVAEAVLRVFRIHIPDAGSLIRHLILPVTFLGASLASRHKQHLSISLGFQDRIDWFGLIARVTPVFFTAAFTLLFTISSVSTVLSIDETTKTAWFVPLWVFLMFLPLGFLAMLYRLRPLAQEKQGRGVSIAFYLGLLYGLFLALPSLRDTFGTLGFDVSAWEPFDLWWAATFVTIKPYLIVLLVISTFLGTPLFVVLGGVAALLFSGEGYTAWGMSMGADPVINASYTLISQDSVPAIALFTLTGFILSESKSGERFVNLFRSIFGVVPGGLVIVTVLVSAFFTTFTGASGVTILALGGLLYAIIMEGGHNTERFSIGLLASSGSIGLLFPPSLAVILYGSVALVDIRLMFLSGLLPGAFMLLGMIVLGIFLSHRKGLERPTFNPQAIGAAFKESFWELLLPVIIIFLFFSGLSTLSETAAFAVVYAMIIEVLVKKEINLRGFRHLAVKSLVIIGGVLIILAVARGLQNYLAENGVPEALSTWIRASIDSPLVFLALLNVLLLIVGCFMDLYSAILIIVPLILPVAASFGINPFHLGMIFLSNLGIGFLTPPVGMNLFLASYRFNRPLVQVYRDVLPFLLLQLVIVLIITYAPFLSTALLPPDALLPWAGVPGTAQ